MAFDFKKEYKEFYRPAKKPAIIEIPPMNFLAVRGMGIQMTRLASTALHFPHFTRSLIHSR